MYRRYYSYSDMPQLVRQDGEKPPCPPPEPEPCCEPCAPAGKLPFKPAADDMILGIVILALLLDGSDDTLLLLALAVIFLAGIN